MPVSAALAMRRGLPSTPKLDEAYVPTVASPTTTAMMPKAPLLATALRAASRARASAMSDRPRASVDTR